MLVPLGILAGVGRDRYFAYAGGGATAGNQNTVDKFGFESESASLLAIGLSNTIQFLSAFANSGTAGYFAGGITVGGGATRTTAVDKFNLANDVRTTLGTGLSTASSNNQSMANSGTAGYTALGSISGSRVATVDKFAFPGDTRTTLGTGISSAREGGAGMANKTVAGYFGGGLTTTHVATVDKYAFPGDTRTTLGTGLSLARYNLGAFSNSGTAGYFFGGRQTTTGTEQTLVDKFAFPSDTRSTLATGLTSATDQTSGAANKDSAGYRMGGVVFGSQVRTIDKFAFPSDTRTALGNKLSIVRAGHGACANEATL